MTTLYTYFLYAHTPYISSTLHNSADSVPTSNLVRIMEAAIRTTVYRWNILLLCSLVIDSQCTPYKNAFNKNLN